MFDKPVFLEVVASRIDWVEAFVDVYMDIQMDFERWTTKAYYNSRTYDECNVLET